MRKYKLRHIVFIIIIIVGSVWLWKTLQKLPSLGNLFRSQPVVIDQTPILIKEIKSIGQLITATAYDEVVVDSTIITRSAAIINVFNNVAPFPVLPSAEKQIVLIGKGKVLAGIDLKQMRNESVKINNDTVTLQLPKAQIIEAIVNPSDFETFEEKGEWPTEAVNRVKIKARQKMIDRALQQNIISKANNKAKAVLENFLHAAGYKTILFIN